MTATRSSYDAPIQADAMDTRSASEQASADTAAMPPPANRYLAHLHQERLARQSQSTPSPVANMEV